MVNNLKRLADKYSLPKNAALAKNCKDWIHENTDYTVISKYGNQVYRTSILMAIFLLEF
jgi:hypothetical protein